MQYAHFSGVVQISAESAHDTFNWIFPRPSSSKTSAAKRKTFPCRVIQMRAHFLFSFMQFSCMCEIVHHRHSACILRVRGSSMSSPRPVSFSRVKFTLTLAQDRSTQHVLAFYPLNPYLHIFSSDIFLFHCSVRRHARTRLDSDSDFTKASIQQRRWLYFGNGVPALPFERQNDNTSTCFPSTTYEYAGQHKQHHRKNESWIRICLTPEK